MSARNEAKQSIPHQLQVCFADEFVTLPYFTHFVAKCTQHGKYRIWILAFRITMIGMPYPRSAPAAAVVTGIASCPSGWPFRTPLAGCGAHVGVPLHSVRGIFPLEANTSCQDV